MISYGHGNQNEDHSKGYQPKSKGKRKKKVSNVQNPVDIPLYWLVNGDPNKAYKGLL